MSIVFLISEDGHIERSQIGAHSCVGISFGLALDCGGRAHGARAGRGGRATLRGRALDFRATRARARRALAGVLRAGRGVNDDRLLLGNTALQHILAQVRHRRALGLQHVLAHIGGLGARRHSCLQDILAHVRLFARRADELGDLTSVFARAFRSRVSATSAHGYYGFKPFVHGITESHALSESKADS
jgi:hypothetical protein